MFFVLAVSGEEARSARPGYDLAAAEQETPDEFRWWGPAEIREAEARGETFCPAGLVDLVETQWSKWDEIVRNVTDRVLEQGIVSPRVVRVFPPRLGCTMER